MHTGLIAVTVFFTAFLSQNGFIKSEVTADDWWKTAVFYQIYPRSWMDSDNDGNGDLQGISSRLDHLANMGVTATWLSPIFQSPKADQGYDISDYRVVDPMFGSNEDLEQLAARAKELGIKLILDFVPNHTSDEHEWFQLSVNRTEGYEDFYIWHDGKINPDDPDKKDVPNNWIGNFGGSPWTWNEQRQQFYYHQFLSKQPDLNYSNPKVVQGMKDILIFWLDHGIDGFRIDAVPYLFEDAEFKDEPLAFGFDIYNISNPNCLNHLYIKDLDNTFDMIYQWRELVDNYKKEHNTSTKVLMTEAYSPIDKQMLFYGTGDGSRLGAHFTFNFNFITNLKIRDFSVDDILKSIEVWQSNLPSGYTSNWVLGNHDNHRVASRLGKENVDGLNMLTSILPGVMVTYYGEEIGMEDGEVNCTEGQDPSADCSNFVQASRDFERTPFHWDNTTNAGFSKSNKTWLPVSEKYLVNNVVAQSQEGVNSHYNIYKDLLKFRSEKLAAQADLDSLAVAKVSQNVLQVTRLRSDGEYTLLFNIGDADEEVKYLTTGNSSTVLISSQGSSYGKGDVIQSAKLLGHEAIIFESK